MTPLSGLSAATALHTLGFWGRQAGVAPVAQAECTPHLQRARTQDVTDKGNAPTGRACAHAPWVGGKQGRGRAGGPRAELGRGGRCIAGRTVTELGVRRKAADSLRR